MDEEDEVPQLVTLDEHLATELDKLNGIQDESSEEDTKKVPITVLTGFTLKTDSNCQDISVQGKRLC
jgi:hypothetical protein